MAIIRTGDTGGTRNPGLNRKIKCDKCRKAKAVYVISPTDGKPLCRDCAPPKWFEGLEDAEETPTD